MFPESTTDNFGSFKRAVVLPALGGYLWMIDYRIPFYGGAVFSLVSLLAVQKIPSRSEMTPSSFNKGH